MTTGKGMLRIEHLKRYHVSNLSNCAYFHIFSENRPNNLNQIIGHNLLFVRSVVVYDRLYVTIGVPNSYGPHCDVSF